ncbi:YbdD/YjiX family protein [Paenibacillus sp. GCM10027628]|uniref:YbdD/YjiX family protein n=1 Tax=Paenibacillus sp. GCM10027628 TaxID=3273413 RepID=UPI0036398E53
MHQIVTNNYVDAILTIFFGIVVILMIIESLRVWYRILIQNNGLSCMKRRLYSPHSERDALRTIMSFVRKTRATIKIIFSIPDYNNYLQHQQEHHPDATPMTEKEFYICTLRDRYESGKINRCC